MLRNWHLSRARKRQRAETRHQAGRDEARQRIARINTSPPVIIERTLRWVEMVGISALLVVAIRLTSPVLAGAAGLVAGVGAGLYLTWPVLLRLDPALGEPRAFRSIPMFLLAQAVCVGSAFATGALGTAIEKAIAAH